MINDISNLNYYQYLYAFKATDALFQPVYLGARNDVKSFDCKIEQLKYKSDEDFQVIIPSPKQVRKKKLYALNYQRCSEKNKENQCHLEFTRIIY